LPYRAVNTEDEPHPTAIFLLSRQQQNNSGKMIIAKVTFGKKALDAPIDRFTARSSCERAGKHGTIDTASFYQCQKITRYEV